MHERSLTIEVVLPTSREGPRILRLIGPLILNTLADFQSRVRTDSSHHLILDFTDVPYVDSAGIGALVWAYVRHHRDENSVSLVGVSNRVRSALALARIDQFFKFFNSLSEAQAKRS